MSGSRRGQHRGHFGHRHPAIVLACLASCTTLVALNFCVVLPLLPVLPETLDAPASSVSWIATATFLVGAATVPIMGRLGDMYGKRRLLIAALACLITGSVVCALSTSLTALVVGRGIQGVAVGLLPLVLSTARDELPPEWMTRVATVVSAAMGVGIATGPVLPGLTGDYHRTFWILAVLAAVAVTAVPFAVPPSRRGASEPLDILGGVLLALFLVLLLLAISKGNDWGWASLATLATATSGCVLAVGWGWYQLKRRYPFVDLRLNGRGPVLLIQCAGVGSAFAMFGNALVNATILQAPRSTGYGLGLGLFATGLAFLPGAAAMIIGARLAGAVIRRWGARPAFVGGAMLIACLYVLRIFVHANVAQVVTLFACVYVGTGLVISATTILVMERVPRSDTGAVLSIHELARFAGQSLYSSLFGAITGWLVIEVSGRLVPSWTALVVLSLAPMVAALITAALGLGVRPVPRLDAGRRPVAKRAVEPVSAVTAAASRASGYERVSRDSPPDT